MLSRIECDYEDRERNKYTEYFYQRVEKQEIVNIDH